MYQRRQFTDDEIAEALKAIAARVEDQRRMTKMSALQIGPGMFVSPDEGLGVLVQDMEALRDVIHAGKARSYIKAAALDVAATALLLACGWGLPTNAPTVEEKPCVYLTLKPESMWTWDVRRGGESIGYAWWNPNRVLWRLNDDQPGTAREGHGSPEETARAIEKFLAGLPVEKPHVELRQGERPDGEWDVVRGGEVIGEARRQGGIISWRLGTSPMGRTGDVTPEATARFIESVLDVDGRGEQQ